MKLVAGTLFIVWLCTPIYLLAGTTQNSKGSQSNTGTQTTATRVQNVKPNTNTKAAVGNSTNAASLKRATRDSTKNKTAWKNKQAAHAWVGHKSEFQKIGIKNSTQLKNRAQEVRNSPDLKRSDLNKNRVAYGAHTTGKKGLVVIDNPSAKNGGTIFFTNNLKARMKSLK